MAPRLRLALLALAFAGAPAAAQEREANAAAESPPAGIGRLFLELQTLQDDVRRLQGIVEEQNHRIERLTREQRERYVELDERLMALERSGAPDDAGSASVIGQPAAPVGAAAPRTEQAAYDAAYDLVKGAGDLPASDRQAVYEEALTMFAALIARYPNGEYAPNAFYWSGEIHLYAERLELARQAFVQAATLFGDHAKVPDALYKLGVVYHRLADDATALRYLDQVADRYPDHTAAGLARSTAAELRR